MYNMEYNEYEEEYAEERRANWHTSIKDDVDQFLSELSTRFVRTIPIQHIDNQDYIEEMKYKITDMFHNTESKYQIDNAADRQHQTNRCIYLFDGFEPCGEQTMEGDPCCFEHIRTRSREDWLVLVNLMVGFELGEILDILQNDIDPVLQEFMRLNTALPEVMSVYTIQEGDLDEGEGVEEVWIGPKEVVVKPDIPKYKDLLPGAQIQDCPVCLDDSVKTTVKLKCSHSLCYSCLEKLVVLTCPCCRAVIDVSEIVRV